MADTPEITKMEALDKAQADYRKMWYAQEPQRKALDVEHDKTWEILGKAWDDVLAEKELRKEVLEAAEKVTKIAKAYKEKLNKGADND